MDTLFNPDLFVQGAKVHLPARTGANGEKYPAVDTEVTKTAWKNVSNIWVCRVAHYSNYPVRVDSLTLING